jgi:hypothetical protein
MAFSMNRFFCCVFSGLFSILPLCQERTPATAPHQLNAIHKAEVKNKVEQLIQSDSKMDRAWAAYFIGEYGLKEFEPALIEILNPDTLAPEGETSFLYRAVLDSVIKLRISVPSDKLMPLYERFPDETLIILARSPSDNGETLLSIAEKPGRQVYWIAACNLLTEGKAPGFAAFLLKSVKITVEITVSEGGGMSGGVGSGGSIAIACGLSTHLPNDLPPISVYKLTQEQTRDAVVIAPGAHPIYYERRDFGSGASFTDHGIPRDLYCLEYLAALINQSVSQLGIRERYSKSIAWSGIQSYKVDVISFRELVKGNFERMKKQCVERNLLSETEAEALKPNLLVTVTDLRENKTTPLPDISETAKFTTK